MGLFGGTFDPLHLGHLAAAHVCREALGLERVLMVVANHPWQKVPNRQLTPAPLRMAMVTAALEGVEGLEASSVEIDRGGPSYSIDTVEELLASPEAARGQLEPVLLMGSDLAASLPTWHRAEELRHLVTLGVVVRPGAPDLNVPPGWRYERVDGPMIDVSSSMVRERASRGQDIDGLVPPAVVHCIRRHGLYAVPR